MNPVIEQKIARFVDRDTEMRDFCRMLDDSSWTRPIMVVWGDGGMGKTSLLLRMMHEASLRNIPRAEVVWRELRADDYLAVMRKIRDDLGAGYFAEFTRAVNFFTDPQTTQKFELIVNAGAISVADNLTVAGSGQIGKVTGLEVRDLMISLPPVDPRISDGERMARLTDNFLRELSTFAVSKAVIVFLDALEKATEVTRTWVWTELLSAVREGRLNNVKFVIGGRTAPKIDEGWQSLVQACQLGPLKRENIEEYVIKRGFSSIESAAVSEVLYAASEGYHLELQI